VIVQIKKNWIPAVLFLRAEKQLLELELLESQLVELEQAVGWHFCVDQFFEQSHFDQLT